MSDDTSSGNLKLPPGFRFHPSDEEIITFYLKPKVLNDGFNAHAIGEVDINISEPWELPAMAKMGEKEWYFYCLKGRKYPSGFRANRATKAGYWKATGKDREIYRSTTKRPVLIGMKKTLVFYKGRAPTGAKTSWVMHEYRLDGSGRPSSPTTESSSSNTAMKYSSSKEEWVVCRIYHKSSDINKVRTPSFDVMNAASDIDQRSTSFPLPMQIPMGTKDFTISSSTLHPTTYSSVPFYSSTSVASTICPPLSHMMGMGNSELQMENVHFRNPISTVQPFSFYHQIRMGQVDDGGLMAELDSGSTPVILHNPRISPHHNNVVDISSMMPTGLATIDTGDGMWKI